MILHVTLRLTIWFLLTADLSAANIVMGVAIAVILPRGYQSTGTFREWIGIIKKIIVVIPQAYFEALHMILRPHTREEVTMRRVKTGRSPALIFLDIFLITFTPKTIALKYHKQGWYEVHRLGKGKQP